MKSLSARFAVRTLTLAVLCAVCAPVQPQLTGGEFAITNTTIDNGGGRSTGGQFALSGTIGQSDASLQTATGGAFQITAGFWARGEVIPPGNLIFSDGFEGP